MTQLDATSLREEYLSRLDDAMRAVPHGVASEIRAGIVEELDGLDAEATGQRIAQLGDPVDVAREAQDEVPASPVIVVSAPVAASSASPQPATSTRGFAITAALVLSFGGFIVPAVGWVVGAVLVCLSPLWRTGEKVVAILVPFVLAGISLLVAMTMWGFSGNSESGSSGGSGAPPVNNPLLPTGYDVGWMTLIALGILLIPASGLWLIWRLRKRGLERSSR